MPKFLEKKVATSPPPYWTLVSATAEQEKPGSGGVSFPVSPHESNLPKWRLNSGCLRSVCWLDHVADGGGREEMVWNCEKMGKSYFYRDVQRNFQMCSWFVKFPQKTWERSQRRGRENLSLRIAVFNKVTDFLQRSIYTFRISLPLQIRNLSQMGASIFSF